MPIYEYRCSGCGSIFEQLVRSNGDQPTACPKCGGKKIEKQFSSFASHTAPDAGLPSCAAGSCSTGNCATGQCPFGGE